MPQPFRLPRHRQGATGQPGLVRPGPTHPRTHTPHPAQHCRPHARGVHHRQARRIEGAHADPNQTNLVTKITARLVRLVLTVYPAEQQSKEPSCQRKRQHRNHAAPAWQTALTVLQEAAPPSIPEGAHAMTVVVEFPPMALAVLVSRTPTIVEGLRSAALVQMARLQPNRSTVAGDAGIGQERDRHCP